MSRLGFRAVLVGLGGLLLLAGACGAPSAGTPQASPAPSSLTPAAPTPAPFVTSAPTSEPETPTPVAPPPTLPPPTPLMPPPATPVPATPTPTPTPAKPITLRDSGEGHVTLEATPATREYLRVNGHPPEHIGFVVALDTHWGDVTVYNLLSLSLLRDSEGRQTSPVGWDALSDDPHHRMGILLFAAHGADGQPTIPAEGWVELLVLYVADVPERVLRWTAPLFNGE